MLPLIHPNSDQASLWWQFHTTSHFTCCNLNPETEFAKTLAIFAFVTKPGQDSFKLAWNLVKRHIILIDPVQSVADQPPAQKDGVCARNTAAIVRSARRAAHQTDIGVIGPGAAIRAASHSYCKRLILKAKLCHNRFNFVQKPRQGSLGFGHGQATCRHGWAGHRPATNRRDLVGPGNMMVFKNLLNGGLVRLLNFRKQDGLLAGKGSSKVELIDNRPQPGLELQAKVVLDPAIFDRNTQKPLAIALLVPAQMVAVAVGAEME